MMTYQVWEVVANGEDGEMVVETASGKDSKERAQLILEMYQKQGYYEGLRLRQKRDAEVMADGSH